MEPHSKDRRPVKRRHKLLHKHSNRVLPPYCKHKRLVVVPLNKLWASKRN